MAQLVASMSGVVLGGVVEVVGSNLARGKIFTASIGSVDSLYPYIYPHIYIYIFFILYSITYQRTAIYLFIYLIYLFIHHVFFFVYFALTKIIYNLVCIHM